MPLHFLFILLIFPLLSQSQSTNIAWECDSVNYGDSVLRFQDKSMVSMTLTNHPRRGVQIQFRNNVFQKPITQRVEGFINSIFNKSNGPEYVIDYQDCLKDFKSKAHNWIKDNYQDLCSGDCPSQDEYISAFNKTLSEQRLIQQAQSLKTIPKIYTGHTQSFSFSNPKTELEKFCHDQRDIDIKKLTSRRFIQELQSEVQALNPILNNKCLTELQRILIENRFNCEYQGYPCDEITKSYEEFDLESLNFTQLREDLLIAQEKALEEERIKEQKKILERNGYRINPSEAENEKVREQIRKMAQNNNFHYCSHYNESSFHDENGRRRSVYQYDHIINEMSDYISENFTKKCLESFIEDYLIQKYRNNDPKDDPFCKENNCDFISLKKETFENNYLQLIRDNYGNESLELMCSKPKNHNQEFNDLRELMSDIHQSNQCSELKIGESKVVDNCAITRVCMRYSLKRESDKKLKAYVAINFQEPSHESEMTSEKMLKRTQECLNNTSSYFKSPNGEVMNVSVISGDEASKLPANQRPRVNNVSIDRANIRSSSINYAENASCATITHEVLHLMGLCDEYRENIDGVYLDTESGEIILKNDPRDIDKLLKDNKAKFILKHNQCRAISQKPSIMSNHRIAMRQYTGNEIRCECARNDGCKDIIQELDEKKLKLIINSPSQIAQNFSTCDLKEKSTKGIYNLEELKNMEEVAIKPLGEQVEDQVKFEVNDIVLSFGGKTLANFRRFELTCKCNDQSCKKEFNQIKNLKPEEIYPLQANCPYPVMNVRTNSRKLTNAQNLEEVGKLVKDEEGLLLFAPPPEPQSSLLHPGHYARIKYGACKSKAMNYATCAQYAYNFHLKSQCPDRPKYCDEDETWLLTEQ